MATKLWQRKEGKSPSGGLNAAGRKSAGVGAPVTEKKPKGKRKARKDAFCARSKSWKSERGKAARRRWKC